MSTDRHVAEFGGRRLAYRRAGTGTGLLYLHDAGADTAAAAVLDDLAADHDVVVVDLPGYGASDPPTGLRSAGAMAALLGDLLDDLGWSRVVVAGTSLGAWFAMELALARPDDVSGLVLCGAAGLHVPEDYLFALFAGGQAAASTQRLLEGALVARLAPDERAIDALPPPVAAAVLGPYVQSLAAAAGCSWHPFTANPRLLGRLPRVTCPVELLWGERDALIPVAHGRALAQAMPRARLSVLPGVGHLVPLEAPGAFAEAVRRVAGAPAASRGLPYPAVQSMPRHAILLADDPETLGAAVDAVADLDPVGVDVERADWNRYYRAAALIQVGGDGRIAVLDPLVLDDLTPMQQLLRTRTVIFHAVENDLAPMESLGFEIPVLHDTAIAAALLGLPTGLETLLRDLLGIEPTGHKAAMQRADWEQRPLTTEMIAYAAGDVADLPALWEELARRLVELERWGWYEQELAAALALPPVEERRDWTRVKGVGRLDPQVRARVRLLWDAREELGKSTNTAPGRILGDRVLLDLAQEPPRSTRELGRRGMRRQAVREFGDALMHALERGPAEHEAARRPGRVPSDADRTLADRLRVLRAERADELGLDPGILCPSRTLLGAVHAQPETPEALRQALGLRPWQWAQLGPLFCDVLKIDWDEGQGTTDWEAERHG
jgi:ribonuclease D